VLGKLVSCVLFSILLTSILIVANTIPAKSQNTITVPDDFSTIQEAINNANEGDTIFVRNGTYLENVIVNKTVVLYAESREATIVDGKGVGAVFQVEASNAILCNFTIQNGDYGVLVNNTEHVKVSDNCVVACGFGGWTAGIAAYFSTDIVINNNLVLGGNHTATSGIFLASYSTGCKIQANKVSFFNSGIYVHSYSNSNIVSDNYVTYNTANNLAGCMAFNNTYTGNIECGAGIYSIDFWYPNYEGGNRFYHNTFSGLGVLPGISNFWDNDCEGNYWSNYAGTDSDGDGIGDIPHIIDSSSQDNYPLMSPYMSGDINHDAIVDIFDIARIAGIFGCSSVDPQWNPHCDVNEDNVIDIFDLVVVAVNFGKEWSSP